MKIGHPGRLGVGPVLLLWVAGGFGCSSVTVDAVRLTSDTFPSKESSKQVEPLARAPARPFREVAELSAHGRSASSERLQEGILERAAELGADAVIFSSPHARVRQGVTYQPVYSPWGYYDPYYGRTPGATAGSGTGGWATVRPTWPCPTRRRSIRSKEPPFAIPVAIPARSRPSGDPAASLDGAPSSSPARLAQGLYWM